MKTTVSGIFNEVYGWSVSLRYTGWPCFIILYAISTVPDKSNNDYT